MEKKHSYDREKPHGPRTHIGLLEPRTNTYEIQVITRVPFMIKYRNIDYLNVIQIAYVTCNKTR